MKTRSSKNNKVKSKTSKRGKRRGGKRGGVDRTPLSEVKGQGSEVRSTEKETADTLSDRKAMRTALCQLSSMTVFFFLQNFVL